MPHVSLATSLLALAAFVALPGAAAADMGFRRIVGDYSIYLAVMPAEVIKGPLPPEPAGASPNRPPAARDTHHVMISIFDSRSGLRISGWRVEARVAALGFSGEKRDLEPLSIGGTTVYGNTFPMLGRGPFRVDVEFSARYGPHKQQTTFYFTHPSFAEPKDSKPPAGSSNQRPGPLSSITSSGYKEDRSWNT